MKNVPLLIIVSLRYVGQHNDILNHYLGNMSIYLQLVPLRYIGQYDVIKCAEFSRSYIHNTSLRLFLCILDSNMANSKFDVLRYPPNIPGAFGSRMYPRYVDYTSKELSGKHVHEQLYDINIARKKNEWRVMKEGKAEEAEQLRAEMSHIKNHSGKSYCNICSETSTEVWPRISAIYHNHFSSKELRMNLPHDHYGQYACITCEVTPHNYKAGDRYAIYVSSSTLANWQGKRYSNHYKGDSLHLDSIAIPGATVKMLHHAFACEYKNFWKPLDVILCGGLNNLLRGQSKEQLMSEIKRFKNYVVRLGNDSGYMHENTFAVCTLLYPPMLSQFELDPPRNPDFRFTDRTWDIYEINNFILELNATGKDAQYTRRAPQPHTFGLRAGPDIRQGNSLGKLNKHRESAWREEIFDQQLHLNDQYRLKMGKMVITYYEYIYGVKYSEYNTRREEAEAYERMIRQKSNKKTSYDARRYILKRKEKRLVREIKEDRKRTSAKRNRAPLP